LIDVDPEEIKKLSDSDTSLGDTSVNNAPAGESEMKAEALKIIARSFVFVLFLLFIFFSAHLGDGWKAS